MAHAQLLGTIGEPGTLSRKQPLQIELNGRLLTLEEYEQLIRLSKQSPNPSSVGNHRPPQSPPTPKTSGAPDERLGSNRTNNGVADNVCGSTNRPDSNDVGPRRTINTITIKTVCTSATPIEKQAINGGLNRPTTTATLINTSSASPGSINNSSPKVFRHTASSSDTKRNNASSSSACIDTPVAATSDRNSRSAVTESLIDSSHLESTAATKQSVQVTRETLRETVHKIPLDQSKTDKTNDLTTTINNPMQAGFVAPTYYTQPFRVAAPRDPASSGSQNVSKVKTGTLRPDDTNRPLSHHAVYRSANQPASSSTTTPVVSYRINPQAHFAAHRQSTDLSAQAITSRFAYGQTPSTAETESNVASGHVQQQIDRLSARLQQQPQLRKSYEKLVQQKHTLTTATCTDGVHEQPRMRQVVEQQMRYADHWNQPAPVTEHRFEQTIEKRLPNGAIDRQVSRQSERNVLPASNADDRQSYLCTSLDGPDLRLNPSRAQRVREELNSDRFVQELRTRIANGSSCTSSPTVAAGRSATLDRKRTSNTAVVNAARSRSVERNKSSVTAKHLATTGTSSFDSSAVGLQSSRDTVDRSVRIGVGSPGGSLATPIVRKTPQEVSQLSQLPPGARYSYACSRNVNGWSEMDDQWIDSNNQLNHNMTGDSSRVSDETLNVSKPSIELESDAAATFRKRDKYGFFVDQSQSSASPNTLRRKLPLEVVQRREKKWLIMLRNWDRFMQSKWVKIRDRCRKGIPESVRGQAWYHLCAAHKHSAKNPNLFALLDQQPGDETINEEIRRDLHRQFPTHEMFADRHSAGQEDLFKILKAFSIVKPEMGYSQGQAPLAAVLLMHLPAEQAFWTLLQLSDHYLPGYFGRHLDSLQIHGQMLHAFLKRQCPTVHKIFKKQRIEPIFYMTEWFMCAFARTLPWSTVLRVLDMFFCEGIRVIFRVALVILRSLEEDFEKANCRKGDKQGEVLALLKNIPKKYLTEDYLIPRVIALDLTEKDLQNEHNIQLLKRKKDKKDKK